MNAEIEWFCHHAVRKGLLSPEECRAVADAIREAGLDPTLDLFVQVVIDNELGGDEQAIRRIATMAEEEARLLGSPKESVFSGTGEGAEAPPSEEEPRSDSAAESAAPPAASGPLPVSTVIPPEPESVEPEPVPSDLAEVIWPDLSAVEDMPPEEAAGVLKEFLLAARRAGCSDVHISAGSYPFVRRCKSIHLLDNLPVVTPRMSELLNLSVLPPDLRETFDQTHDLDWCLAASETQRYRVNVMLQRLGVAGSYRIIDSRIRTIRELGFPQPEVIEKLTTYHQGLILVTGPAGCGKSTTLAALVDLINTSRKDHIITIEDPIEIVHRPKNCNITQREIGRHTRSFANALRAALREDPDIIVIGELRDLETIEMAIRAAETGHLVIGTLHTGDASSTMDRILDVFPPAQQAQVRSMAAESLKGVICQQLLPDATGQGVVLASEIMLGTLAVSNIIREGETFKLPSVIQTSTNIGMRLMEQSIFELYMQGRLTYEQAAPKVRNPDLIREMQANEARKGAAQSGAGKKRRSWFR